MSRDRGGTYENLALNYLQRRGLRLEERNYCCKAGEIDLIMRENDILAFVEVRFRESPDYGGALASVTPAKQRRIARAAAHYLQGRYPGREPYCRFDVVGIHLINERAEIDWIPNAFTTQWH